MARAVLQWPPSNPLRAHERPPPTTTTSTASTRTRAQAHAPNAHMCAHTQYPHPQAHALGGDTHLWCRRVGPAGCHERPVLLQQHRRVGAWPSSAPGVGQGLASGEAAPRIPHQQAGEHAPALGGEAGREGGVVHLEDALQQEGQWGVGAAGLAGGWVGVEMRGGVVGCGRDD